MKKRMQWYQNLYVGEKAREKQQQIIRKVENKEVLWTVYLITLAPDERNQLEIVTPMVYYSQEKRYRQLPVIVGLACGMQEAKKLLLKMTQELYEKTGDVDFRSYYLQ